MPFFELDVFELVTESYRIEADDYRQAVERFLEDWENARWVPDSTVHIERCDGQSVMASRLLDDASPEELEAFLRPEDGEPWGDDTQLAALNAVRKVDSLYASDELVMVLWDDEVAVFRGDREICSAWGTEGFRFNECGTAVEIDENDFELIGVAPEESDWQRVPELLRRPEIRKRFYALTGDQE